MGDNRSAATSTSPQRVIAGFDAHATSIAVGDDRLAFWEVRDLERYVDRDALLRAEAPADPPYWAHCWSGARTLAERVPHRAGRVIEIGCGLGLPGVVAARRGARVVFVDREAAPLAFVRATLASNACTAVGLVVGDACALAWRNAFDLVLAAEVLYDRAAFPALADALLRLLAPDGRVLLADGHRIDTRAFYEVAVAAGLRVERERIRVIEEGFPLDLTIATLSRQ